ncbi:MAG TPA: Gfo/Idh/MocA family oxidoreductase [Christensenellaceae bacterium]|jgi:predicted dehydrogenase|nr:Gfo/Idh/MocA family oxidoreductase [Christensenellaceae bacterium]
MKIGVIGAGDFGVLHLEVYNQIKNVEIAWICVRNPEKICGYADKYNCQITNNYNDLLKDPTVEAIGVLTPESVHFEHTIAALEHGKHVLVEKPVSTNVKQVEMIAQKARETGLIVMPGHTCRFINSFARARSYINDNQLKPVSYFARRNIPRERLALHNRTHPVFMALSHDIDLIISYSSCKPKQIFGMQNKTDPELINPDVFWGMIQFEDNSIATLETLWVLPTSGKYVESYMEIATTEEIVHINYPSDSIWIDKAKGRYYPDPSFFERINDEWVGALRNELNYFIRCVESKTMPNIVTIDEAIVGIRIAQLLIRSAEEKRPLLYSEAT